MELSLKGRNALITGAGAGIGLACARVFVAAGANVAICDVEQARLDDALSLLTEIGGNHYGQLCDVANAEAVADFFRNSQSALGSLDITLNNAGVGSPLVPLAETDEADYDRLMGINLKGVWLCMRESLKIMSPAGSGHIINMASALSKTTFPGAGLYVASKHAVGGLTRNTAVEYGESGIRINAICPGFIETPLLRESIPEEDRAHLASRHPMNRLGTPEDVAKAALWLASDASSFVTGMLFSVDGGWTAI
ncbi:glucose 1-dehydrogenase [Luminiphilus sp.]|jgi:NAD(P)-dependent dehydrogenase (short-subunit alcohol dehydrogenase family)|nr:glucose 1-dehydrogenase [Luminiphilus sp.]MDA8619361.1 glucose 1-dehydrogenase [Luminiphilus sp.]MDC6472091.1 glucose 1-dehydrogenase [Luminiphilus sp.]